MHDVPNNRMEWSGFKQLAPDANAALVALGRAIDAGGLDHGLIELVKLRASQLNGCAFCLHWHAEAGRKLGLSEEKLQLLAAWREAPVYSQRERAALDWAESLTLLANRQTVPDDVYEAAQSVFSDAELATLTSAIVLINAWNRVGVAYRFTPMVVGYDKKVAR